MCHRYLQTELCVSAIAETACTEGSAAKLHQPADQKQRGCEDLLQTCSTSEKRPRGVMTAAEAQGSAACLCFELQSMCGCKPC